MTDTTAMQQGIDAASPHAQEVADVRRWQKRLKGAREYDKPAREQYARDRGYARGDSGSDMNSRPSRPAFSQVSRSTRPALFHSAWRGLHSRSMKRRAVSRNFS